MIVKINYKTALIKKVSSNLVLFSDEKYNLLGLKKYISNSEYSIISELIKGKDLNKKIVHFDINSKRKIILVLFKKNLSDSDAENLGANFYDQFKETKQTEFYINSDTTSVKKRHLIGNFLHGIKLKSYNFDKYKTKKKKEQYFN